MDQLGAIVLFNKVVETAAFSEAGRLFHERTRSIMLDLEEARVMAAALEDKPSGLVRIALPASFEQHVVVATALFQARWPDVSFGLTSTERNVDLVAFPLALTHLVLILQVGSSVSLVGRGYHFFEFTSLSIRISSICSSTIFFSLAFSLSISLRKP